MSTPVAAMAATVSRVTPARCFRSHPAANHCYGFAQHRKVHVVEQHDIGPLVDHFGKLIQPVHLDLDLHGCPTAALAARKPASRPGDRDVVVLDQHGIIQPIAVVGAPPAAFHRVFFESA
jgi:hypothetical protein